MLTDANGNERKGIEWVSGWGTPYRITGSTVRQCAEKIEHRDDDWSEFGETVRDLMLAGF